MSSASIDEVNLRLILVSGKTQEFVFSPNASAADIAKHVYENWPMGWDEEQDCLFICLTLKMDFVDPVTSRPWLFKKKLLSKWPP